MERLASASAAPSPLDVFIPEPDIRERFGIRIKAPAALVFEAGTEIDLQSLSSVRWIFRLREKLMGAAPPPPRQPQGMLRELLGLGWGVLVDQPGRLIVGGAACQPWKADVVFHPIPADRFASYDEPDHVKIAWTLEAEPIGPDLTRYSSETRAVATDGPARLKFRRYWRWARFGIVAIRLLLLPAVRREAERRWRSSPGGDLPYTASKRSKNER
jgi:hypothetical protein